MSTTIANAATGQSFDSLNHTLAGKLRRLMLFPAFTLSSRGIAQAAHRLRTARAAKKLEKLNLSRLIRRVDGEALRQDPADLLFLYETVRNHRPERAIEFGSGQSTTFIAQGLHDAGGGHLWSLDADTRWLNNTEETLPEHLRPYVTFVDSPVVVSEKYGVPAFRYSVMPPGEWDFVLIDGPALTPDIRLSCDLVDLPLTPGAVGMIDHRWRSATLAKEVAGRRMRVRFMPSLESFSILAR